MELEGPARVRFARRPLAVGRAGPWIAGGGGSDARIVGGVNSVDARAGVLAQEPSTATPATPRERRDQGCRAAARRVSLVGAGSSLGKVFRGKWYRGTREEPSRRAEDGTTRVPILARRRRRRDGETIDTSRSSPTVEVRTHARGRATWCGRDLLETLETALPEVLPFRRSERFSRNRPRETTWGGERLATREGRSDSAARRAARGRSRARVPEASIDGHARRRSLRASPARRCV